MSIPSRGRARRARQVVRCCAAVVVAAVVLLDVATARVGTRFYRLRMDGYVGAAQAGRREMADLRLRVERKDVRFQVSEATVLSGSILAADIFERVRPYTPNFILRGSPDLLRRVENAAPDTRLRIVGQWRPGARDLMVASVERADGPAPPRGDRPPAP